MNDAFAAAAQPQLPVIEGPALYKREWSLWVVIPTLVVAFIIQQLTIGVVLIMTNRPLLHEIVRHAPINRERLAIELLTPSGLFYGSLAADFITVAFILFVGIVFFGATLSKFGLARPVGRDLFVGAMAGVGLWLVAVLIALAQTALLGPHPQLTERALAAHRGVLPFLMDAGAVSVLAPFVEELMFRGWLFAALVQRLPLPWAATISGVLFGLAHVDPYALLPLSVIGVGLAILYYRSRSLWTTIAAHCVNNFISLALVFAFPKLVNV